MNYDDFLTLCKQRRSIRYFDQKPVAKEDVMKLLELARIAPSVENVQPWHFHVIYQRELLIQLMESSCYGNFVEGAGVFILATCDRSLLVKALEPVWNPRELEYSCMAAMEHILLGATSMGLGSTWVSLHHGAPHELMGLSKDVIVVGGVMIGHYKPGEEQASNGRQRKSLPEIYTLHE